MELAQRVIEGKRVRDSVRGCVVCPLSSNCNSPVPFRGASDGGVVVVGEAPGAKEDEQGSPFVGPSGLLATRLLSLAGIDDSLVAWLNVVSCFPNRTPSSREVEACRVNLDSQLDFLAPTFALVFGGVAVSAWQPMRIGEIRGRWWRLGQTGAWAMATWHPSAILRSGGLTSPRGIEALRDVKAFSEFVPKLSTTCVKCLNVDRAVTYVKDIPYCERHHPESTLGKGRQTRARTSKPPRPKGQNTNLLDELR